MIQSRERKVSAAHNVELNEIREFWSLVEPTGKCWEFRNGLRKNDDCYFHVFNGVRMPAAEVAWYINHGAYLPQGMKLEQTCKNPLCIVDEHQRQVVDQTKIVSSNVRRHEKVVRAPSKKEELKQAKSKTVSKSKDSRKKHKWFPPSATEKIGTVQPSIIEQISRNARESLLDTWLQRTEEELQLKEERTTQSPSSNLEPFWWERQYA